MNIKKLSTERPLLTIDDPTIYEGEYSEFLNVASAASTSDIQEPDSDTLYLIGTSSATLKPYIYSQTGTWAVMPNPFSRGPSLPYPTVSNMLELNDNLIAIDNHLYALRKQLSYWNLYQISYSADTIEDFTTILSSLAPGEAMIVNGDGLFSYDNKTYKRGDVIIRLTNGEFVTIESSTSGFYYPSLIQQSTGGQKSYTMTYKFAQGAAPVIDQATIPDEGPGLQEPAKEETFTVEGGSAQDSFIYGIREDMSSQSSYTFNCAIHDSNPIPPIIKFFTEDGEEIFLDHQCSLNQSNTTYTVNISDGKPSALKYMYIK